MGNPTYKKLEDLNTMLENAISTLDNTFSALENLEEASISYAQQKVDKMCEQISNRVNNTLEAKKQEAIDAIKAKYNKELETLATLKPIVDLLQLNISLDTIVTVVAKIIQALAGPYVKPYQDAVQFVQQMTTEITPLVVNVANNTTELLNKPNELKSKIQEINPQLNTDKLNISFTPPSVNDFIG